MEWLFFQSQPHRPVHVRREVFVAPSPHPEIQFEISDNVINMVTEKS